MSPECVIGSQPTTGSITPSGLKVAGLFTEIAINSTGWTALPASPLANRNAIAIQNRTGVEVKVNYDPSVIGYHGMVIPDLGERQYDITDTIFIYAMSQAGNVTLFVEELS